MRTKLVRIGSSPCIRIPKAFIEQSNLTNEVELEIVDDNIVIKPVSKIRDKWESAFRKMNSDNDDFLYDKVAYIVHAKWTNEEWEW